MTKQQIAFHRSPHERRQCLLNPGETTSCGGKRIAEVAGGTTAECAAVICCFPCTVVTILVLAVYKVPAGLCRKALRKKRRRRMLKNGLLIGADVSEVNRNGGNRLSFDRSELAVHPAGDEEFVELENEMWETFYGTGFWRSLSQRVG